MSEKVFLAGLLMCLAATATIAGCTEKDQEDKNGDATVMTFGQFLVDSKTHVDNETKQVMEWFQSLDEGDTLLIRDTINKITYMEAFGFTSIDFASSYIDDSVMIEGDITNDYSSGDRIMLQLTIIRDTFTWEDTTTGELWTYNFECIQEMWDTEQKNSVPIPSYYIRHAGK